MICILFILSFNHLRGGKRNEDKLNIGIKLGSVFGLLLVLIVVMGFFGINSTRKINASVEEIGKERYAKTVYAFQASKAVLGEVEDLQCALWSLKRSMTDYPDFGPVFQDSVSVVILGKINHPLEESFSIFEQRFSRVFIVFFLHLLIIQADTAMRGRITGQVTAMNPEIHPLAICEKPESVIHRILFYGLLDKIKRRVVPRVECVDSEITAGSAAVSFSCGYWR